MPNSDQRPKVTIEDLLRLKRAERPAVEFWGNFERELRQKQLTALLEKRPWWQTLPQVFTRRAYLPVGATAILAFTLLSVKYYAPAQIAQAVPASVDSTQAVAAPIAAAAKLADSPAVAAPVTEHRELIVPVSTQDSNAVMVAAAAAPVSAENIEVIPSLIAPPTAETPSSRSIAANLARLEQSEPDLINSVLGSRLSPSARVEAAAAPTTELASVPTDLSKRSRILAQYSDRPLSPEPTAPEIVRERLARRLVDPEISERLSRIGLKGDQVSLGLTLRL